MNLICENQNIQLQTNHRQPLKKFSRLWKSAEETATSVGVDEKLGLPVDIASSRSPAQIYS